MNLFFKQTAFQALKLLFVVVFIFDFQDAKATHIIGGDLTYVCLGNSKYRFILKVYRDKSSTSVLDAVAKIGFIKCNIGGSGIQCASLRQSNVQLFSANLLSKRDVPPPPYDCVETPPNINVEVGTYEFELTLPYSATETYHIFYQRCCRNTTINNITNPLDYGATYSIQIPPSIQSQNTCINNSPVFKEFPPIVICSDYPLNFDHSAVDSEGDSLIYSFCAPVNGGGRSGNSGCNSPAPDPPCPPPFTLIPYRSPYTVSNPMGGSPIITINPSTGRITGIPTVQGQFVVSICVDEYRKGVKIGTITREFQFNVTSCKLSVTASIQADSIKPGKKFILNSCGATNVKFLNYSQERAKIRNTEWTFNINNQPEVKNSWDAEFDFVKSGTYLGTLIVNKGLPCSDTAKLEVNLFPETKADFDFISDSCSFASVGFSDHSFSGSGSIKDWFWNFNSEGSSIARSPNFSFRLPGIKKIFLRVKDGNTCTDTVTKFIRYFPVPPLINASSSHYEICEGAPLTLKNLSQPIDTSYGVRWSFGDGFFSTLASPVYTYPKGGKYDITLEVVSPNGCKGSRLFKELITVLPKPIANFEFSPKSLSTFNKTAQFLDKSIDAVRWNWTFGNEFSSFHTNPTYTFQDTGVYKVRLLVTNMIGCIDTITIDVDVEPKVSYFLPNAFSPNNDGKNDEFLGIGEFYGIKEFSMVIYNRWGEKIFVSSQPDTGWNGRKNNIGNMEESGVYVCIIEYTTSRGERKKQEGFATLIR